MVSRGNELLRQIPENSFAIVLNFASFAVHDFLRANYAAAERCPDGLMSQTNAEYRNFARETRDKPRADSSCVSRTGAGRNHDAFRPQNLNLVQGHLVVATNFELLTHLAEILSPVVGKCVV